MKYEFFVRYRSGWVMYNQFKKFEDVLSELEKFEDDEDVSEISLVYGVVDD